MTGCQRCRSARIEAHVGPDGLTYVCLKCGRTETVPYDDIQHRHDLLNRPARTVKANTCQRCARPVRDALVCSVCIRDAAQALGDVGALSATLTETIARQTRYSTGQEGGRSAEVPLPFHTLAADIFDTLQAVLVGWCRIYAEENHADLPAGTLTAMSRWLLNRVEWFRHRDYAQDFVEELVVVVDNAHRVVDTPPRTIHVGPCPEDECPGEVRLFIAEKSQMECDVCGMTWSGGDHKVNPMLICAKRILDVMLADCAGGNHRWRGKTCWVCEAVKPVPSVGSVSLMLHVG